MIFPEAGSLPTGTIMPIVLTSGTRVLREHVGMLWTWDPKTAVTLLRREHELLDSQWQALQTATDHNVEMSLIHECVLAQFMFMCGHFRNEERLMHEVAYPAYEAHRADHDVFVNEIGSFLIHLPASSESWPEATACLHAWINRHNGEHDRELSRFVARLDYS
jgi:hemerythrin-like metal-binding protein